MHLISEYKGLRKELYVLFVGRVMTNLGSMIWPMLTLILKIKFDMSAAQIALYILAFTVVNLPINLIGGKLADKFNKKNVIVICDGISILGFLLCSFLPLTMGTMIIFSISSIFQSVEYPSYEALVADFTTAKDRERAYSLSYLGNNLGMVIAPILAGFLINDYLNVAFFINGIAIAFSTLLIFFLIKDVHRETGDGGENEYEKDLEEGTSTLSFLRGNGVLLLFLAAGALEVAVYSMYNYLMPLDMDTLFGERGAVYFGTLSSVNCVVVLLCTALITHLFRKMRETEKMFIGETLILGGFLIFFLFAKQLAFCYVAIVIFTFGEIFSTISSAPFLTKRIPASHRGRILSVDSVLSGVASAAIPYLVGLIYDNHGSSAAWLFILGLGSVVLVLFRVMILLDRKVYKKLYEEPNNAD